MQTLNLAIFPEPLPFKHKTLTPNWPYCFFLKYKPEFQQSLLCFAEKTQSSYSFFLKGLSREYGILSRKNLQIALGNYREGSELNDAFCHYKLYCIYNEDFQKYHIPRNRDLALAHLVQSAAFWNPNYTNNDLSIHLNPKAKLGELLEKEDENLVKIRLLIHKFFKNQPLKFNYLTNWLMIEYHLEADLAEFHFNELIIFVENTNYPEACFYYASHLKASYFKEKNQEAFSKAEELFSIATKANVIKAHFPMAQLYEEAGLFQEAINVLKKGAKLGCFLCLHSLSGYYSIGMNTVRDFPKAIKYALGAFILGDLTAGHTFRDIGIYIRSVGLESRVLDLDRNIYTIAENLAEIESEFNMTLHKVGANAYILAKCMIYGINCDINIKKGLEIIDKALPKVEDKKYLLYIKARILMKLGESQNESVKEAFQLYEGFIKNEKNKKFPQHFYRIGKLYENGWGVDKDSKKAKEFYQKGAFCIEEKPNMCWMQFLYLQKCKGKNKDIAAE